MLALSFLVADVAAVCSSPLFRFVSFAFGFAVSVAHFVRNVNLFCNRTPNLVDAVSIVQTLEDAVATDHDEVKVVLDFE